jgi:branched-chain amino acid transport system substrate-binding protein
VLDVIDERGYRWPPRCGQVGEDMMGKGLSRPVPLLALLAVLVVAAVACGSDKTSGTADGGAGGTQAKAAADALKCGAGTGEKATGEPIKFGAIVTKIPGIDFTDGSDATKAYFDCVNDNGGIHGRPVQLVVAEHGIDPQQVGSLAVKLAESDKVDAFVGGFSILDCPVNHGFYEKHGFYVIVAGVPNECFNTPNIAAVDVGPAYSTLGAAGYLVRKGAKAIVIVSPNQAGNEAVNQLGLSVAKAKGIKAISRLETVPVSDPASLAQALVAQAGDGGGVVLDFTPPEAVKIMQAAAQQGLIDKVMWGSSTPMNDLSAAKAVGSAWDGKIAINAELAALDSTGPDMQLYRAVNKKYSPDNPVGAFGQMGFVQGKLITDVLLGMDEADLDRKGINEAILNIKNYKTDLLCKPWYFQKMPVHLPNNTDITVTPKDGKLAVLEGCKEIPATNDDLKLIRKFEAENDVNKG